MSPGTHRGHVVRNWRILLAVRGVTWYPRVIARHDDEVFDIDWNYYTHALEVNITYWENSDNLQYG